MSSWHALIEIHRIRPAPRGTFVEIAGRELAVFPIRQPPGYAVIDNVCPHARGNLSGGTLEGDIVACPWHGWRFDVRDGRCVQNPAVRVSSYECEVREGTLFVRIEEMKPESSGCGVCA